MTAASTLRRFQIVARPSVPSAATGPVRRCSAGPRLCRRRYRPRRAVRLRSSADAADQRPVVADRRAVAMDHRDRIRRSVRHGDFTFAGTRSRWRAPRLPRASRAMGFRVPALVRDRRGSRGVHSDPGRPRCHRGRRPAHWLVTEPPSSARPHAQRPVGGRSGRTRGASIAATWPGSSTTSSSAADRRVRSRQPPDRGPADARPRPGSRALRLADRPLHPHAGGPHVPDRQPVLRLALRVRAGAVHARPSDLPRARQGPRWQQQHQRSDLPARQPTRFRAWAADPGMESGTSPTACPTSRRWRPRWPRRPATRGAVTTDRSSSSADRRRTPCSERPSSPRPRRPATRGPTTSTATGRRASPPFDRNIHRGRRLSAARAYLHPILRKPREPRGPDAAIVTRVLFEGRARSGWRSPVGPADAAPSSG